MKKLFFIYTLAFVSTTLFCQAVQAAPPPKIKEFTTSDAKKWAPRFDYDTDGCYPSVGIGRNGQANGGLKPTGSIGGGCRDNSDLANSNTNHRSTCVNNGSIQYCAHMYALYFEKDQAIDNAWFDDVFSHRHDWEYVIVWLTNNNLTHISYSKHRGAVTAAKSDYAYDDAQQQHVRIVYHKDGASTHVFRPGGAQELAENATGAWHTPTLASWQLMQGDVGTTNADLQYLFNSTSFDKANTPFNDGNFINKLNSSLPTGYPGF